MNKRSLENLLRWDAFKQPVPSFTLNRRHEHGTMIGFFCTLALYVLILAYGAATGHIFLKKGRPMISSHKKLFALEQPVNMDKIGFTFAFRVSSGFLGGWENLHDPNFVEFSLAIKSKKTTENNEKLYEYMPLGFHNCTKHDEDEYFYKEQGKDKKPNLSKFYCLDKHDKFGNPVDLNLFDS